ncbi:MAG: 30S ribosomal protein S17 [Microgenomates group bacterium]
MKQIKGIVVAHHSPKTAKVEVTHQWQHPIYLKRINRTKLYACHVDGVEIAVGDSVHIEACRPMSKTKKFKVVGKVEN